MGGQYDQIIGDTLAMVNVVRQAFGKDPLNELPESRQGAASDCLFYRGLADVGVRTVTGDTMTFESARVASAVATLWGTETKADSTAVRVPRQFNAVVHAFDGGRLEHYNTPDEE